MAMLSGLRFSLLKTTLGNFFFSIFKDCGTQDIITYFKNVLGVLLTVYYLSVSK